MDFFLALSPIPIIVPLTMALSRKIILCGLLALGVFDVIESPIQKSLLISTRAGICCAVKTALLVEITGFIDVTWDEYDLSILSQ